MHRMVNSLFEKQKQLESLLSSLPADEKYRVIKRDGDALVKKMKAWDEDMVQRKSKAYDDVENFPDKFTANYLFMINHAESDIPRVNQPTLDRLKELNAQWATLKARGNELLDRDIPNIQQTPRGCRPGRDLDRIAGLGRIIMKNPVILSNY